MKRLLVAAILLLLERASRARKNTDLSRLKARDEILVYHGSPGFRLWELLNGFDANRIMRRYYQPSGYRHAGLFVAPDLETTHSFSPTSAIEIRARVRDLHGTDFSGNFLSRKAGGAWMADKFPDSERPYLSYSLTSFPEPQAILRGLISPKRIPRVWYKGKWYSRKAFLNEVGPSIRSDKPLRDVGYDLSYPGYSAAQFLEAIAAVAGGGQVDAARVEHLFRIMRGKGRLGYIEDKMLSMGFGPTAVASFLRKFREEP